MSRSKWLLSVVLVAVLCLGLSLPAYADGAAALINADELKGIIGEDGLVVVDIRAAELYAEGHIPGAVSVQTSEFYEERDGIKQMAAGPEKFSALLSRIGVNDGSKVVVYAAGDKTLYATRLWWNLKMYGHENAQVLNGGIDSWVRAGFETSTEPVTPTPSVYNVGAVDESTVATFEEVKAARAGDAVIVDCRDAAFFAGQQFKAARSGHIAGAVLVAQKDNLNSDGTFKSAADLEKLYAAHGITADTPVITCCNTGTTATLQYFVLTQILGYDNVQVFDASLFGWAADPTLPMESDYDYFALGKGMAEVNASFVELPVAPYAVEGRTFIPADVLAAGLNAEYGVDGQVVTFKADNKVLTTTVGANEITVNGQKQMMDIGSMAKDGAVFVPVRPVAEALGAEVSWDNEKQLVTVG